MKPNLSIIKIGGNIIEDPKQLNKFLKLFAQLKGDKILVHGGGKSASAMESRLDIQSEYFQGRRITGAESLEVMIMVYAGLINKRIVAGLQAEKCNAIGLSGADGSSVLAIKRPVGEVDFGLVGDVISVNTETLSSLLNSGLVPVFCALTHDGSGQMFNTNADTIASELAIGLSGCYNTTLYYCFEKKGVLEDIEDDDSVIRHIDTALYKNLLEGSKISDGMLPKLHNCFRALESNVERICIGQISMLGDEETLFTSITL